jgi:hypothetical protein
VRKNVPVSMENPKNDIVEYAIALDNAKNANQKLQDDYNSLFYNKQQLEMQLDEITNMGVVSAVQENNTGNSHNSGSIKTVTKIKYINVATKPEKNNSKTQLIYPDNLTDKVYFVYDRNMREDQTYQVTATINLLLDDKKIKSKLLKTVNESRILNNEKPFTLKDIITKKINLGYYIKIELVDINHKFKIDSISKDINHEPKKIFNETTHQYSKENFEWKWYITPKINSKGTAKLMLVTTPLDKNKQPIEGKRDYFKISIGFKQNFIASIWDKMNRNVEWAFAGIITPLLTFMAGRYLKKKETNPIA